MNSIRVVLGSPATHLVIAAVAFAAALVGEWDDIIVDLADLQFTGQHGVLLLALWHMLMATTQLLSKADALIESQD